MTERRPRGEGGPHYDESRKRWVATRTIGWDGRGKRLTRRAYGRTKTEAKVHLRDLLRQADSGVAPSRHAYTVRDAVEDWLAFGLGREAPSTITKYQFLCNKHVIPFVGSPEGARSHRSEVDLRALDWSHVHLVPTAAGDRDVPPHVEV